MSDLAKKKCIPCRAGTPPLTASTSAELLQQLDAWQVIDNHHLTKTYKFPDFVSALAWTNKLGAIAEQEGHHPDIYLTWGKVKVKIWTHSIDGLSEGDFILAAKADAIDSAHVS